ncbi:glycerol-3-phosphate dehydrogenase [Sphingobium sp.]|uniref:glycerol-3-phosphate dehydrogenase n=1 Tax=Sphingobium sp. TaxID=1912891 RepID=UPI0025EEFCCE|nr:glycerol-3-phosphate dehydrogenase [Sphingobium sp.]
MPDPYDMLIVGGGVNGTAIARAAALAGQSVLLVEQGDLAQGTSSASTKLMHGGLRYLEYYEFKLVREALAERAIMLRTAPHIVRPLEFRLPHMPAMRPWPVVRMGLWLYDLFALGGGLPRSRGIRQNDPALTQSGGRGFSYWDGWVDDARLVVLNAMDAAEAGAEIRTHTRMESAQRQADQWTATLRDKDGAHQVAARTIVNAAGPWVEQVLHGRLGQKDGSHIRLVRGCHIVVKRCLTGDHAWMLQQPDGRIVFAIPYLDDFTLIGTTEVTVDNPTDTAIATDEIAYLLAAANRYLRTPLHEAAIVGSYGGIRPLVDDGTQAASAVSRDYRLELDRQGAPLLSVFGGKITTARHLAQAALDRLEIAGGDTRERPLPGGDIAAFGVFLVEVRQRWPFLDEHVARRMAQAYGSRIGIVMGDARTFDDLGADFGAGLRAREVDYLCRQEWARGADDILWRRTKLGYYLKPAQVEQLSRYVREATA